MGTTSNIQITSKVAFSQLNKQDSIKFYGIIRGILAEWEFVIKGKYISLNNNTNTFHKKEPVGGELSRLLSEVLSECV